MKIVGTAKLLSSPWRQSHKFLTQNGANDRAGDRTGRRRQDDALSTTGRAAAAVLSRLLRRPHRWGTFELVNLAFVTDTIRSGQWKVQRSQVFDAVERAIAADHLDNQWVFVDDNFYYRSMRYAYFRLAKARRVGYCQVWAKSRFRIVFAQIFIECSPDTCRSRRQSTIPAQVLDRMIELMQSPDASYATVSAWVAG